VSAPPGSGRTAEPVASPGAIAFSDAAGEAAGVLIAAHPGADAAGALPLVAFALGADEARLLAAAGEGVSLEVGRGRLSWRWAAAAAGLAGELEVTPTDEASAEGAIPASDSTTTGAGSQGWGSCRVSGRISGPDGERAVQGSGLLGAGPVLAGATTPLTRWLAAWLGDGRAVMLDARRPRRGSSHASEQIAAWVRDEAGATRPVAEPLLSTTYDAAGRPRHAGLELWMDEEAEFPRRAAGEALAAATVRARGVRWDVSFLSWTMEGQAGNGPYVIARREG